MDDHEGLFPELDAAEREESEAARTRLAAAETRLREREADFTPRLVARAVVEAVLRCTVTRGGERILGTRHTVWQAIGEVDAPRPRGADLYGPFLDLDADRRRVFEVLDICCGAGVWASEVHRFAAAHGFEVRITAVDYEPDERANLLRHAHEVIIGDWHEALGMVQDERGVWVWGPERRKYDLVIGNPAFSQARAATRAEWPRASGPPKKPGGPATVTKAEARERKRLTDKMLERRDFPERAEYDTAGSMPALCLECAPAVVLYTTQQCYLKTSSGWLARLDYPYAVVYEIPSSIGHRGRGEGQDDKPYAAFVWLRGRGEPTETFMLEPIADRNWDERPGTESDAWLAANGIPVLRPA